MSERDRPALAYTVHFKGKVYPAGTEADQIGEVANELGDHVWIDGKAPAKVSGDGNPLASTPVGRPPASMSALPTPGAKIDPPEEGEQSGGSEGGSARSARSRSRSSES